MKIFQKVAALAANPAIWAIFSILSWMAFGSQYTAANSFRMNPVFTFAGYMEIVKGALIWAAIAIICTVIFGKTLIGWVIRKTYKK